MVGEPRVQDDYSQRGVEAAHRVIVDVMQVLASFEDCIVLVGGLVPYLLMENFEERHVGSIDVDLALDAAKLSRGRYAEMLMLLINTGRYRQGDKEFQLMPEVDLDDGERTVAVNVEFLAPKEVRTEKNRPKLLENFRVLKADGCGAAFRSPLSKKLRGRMVSGAENTVTLRVASLSDFLVMKAFALKGRDKPKDAYDICFCLDFYVGGISELAKTWRVRRKKDADVSKAIEILKEKFDTVDSFGPMQLVAFHNSPNQSEREEQARRAYELVQEFLREVVN